MTTDRTRDVLAADARKAYGDGLPVFITVLSSQTLAGTFGGATGSSVGAIHVRTEWSRRVAAIEAEGWRLEQ